MNKVNLCVRRSFLSFKVVRLCAKSREAVSSPVEHLTLHYQVSFAFFFQPIFFPCHDCV